MPCSSTCSAAFDFANEQFRFGPQGGHHASNRQGLAILALGLALATATTATGATPPTGTQDQTDQRQALYQSERERALARQRAAQPAAKADPVAPNPGVDVPATLLVGLLGGLIGGAAVMVGWTAITRRRRPQTATGTVP